MLHDWRGWAFLAVGVCVAQIVRHFRPDLYKKWFGRRGGGDDSSMGGHPGDGGHGDGGDGH
jgi:hypothetical protein